MNDLHIERVDQILVIFKINSSCLTDSFILSWVESWFRWFAILCRLFSRGVQEL